MLPSDLRWEERVLQEAFEPKTRGNEQGGNRKDREEKREEEKGRGGEGKIVIKGSMTIHRIPRECVRWTLNRQVNKGPFDGNKGNGLVL